MNTDKTFYNKLVDLYAGQELPEDLEKNLSEAAASDPDLAKDMATLRQTVQSLHGQSAVNYTEDTEYRVLMKLQAWAESDLISKQEESPSWQYRLPMEG